MVAKKRVRRELTCPVPFEVQSGCKVGWNYYREEADALAASAWAKVEAGRLAAQGFDFGYQAPGEIRRRPSDGAFVVVMP